jgi:hypothetical protein
MVAWTSVVRTFYELELMMLLSSLEEAGFYLSTFKSFEHKPPDLIRERVDKDFGSMYRTSLTSISKVNKTDVETLKTNCGVRSLIVLIRIKSANRRPLSPSPISQGLRQTRCSSYLVSDLSK